MSLTFKGPEIHEDFVDYIVLNEIAHKIGNVYRSHDDTTWKFMPNKLYSYVLLVENMREIAEWCKNMNEYETP